MTGVDVTQETQPPQPQSRASLRGCLIKAAATTIAILTLCTLCSAWFVPYAQYKSSHDIPNPFWGILGKTVTYTPEQGPPSPDLLDTRLEVVILYYITDYQKLAGTIHARKTWRPTTTRTILYCMTNPAQCAARSLQHVFSRCK